MKYAIISFGVFLFSVPITVKVRLFLSVSDKKVYYSLFIYEKLRVNSGYLSYKNKYVILNFSDKRAVAVSLKSLLKPQLFNPNLLRVEVLRLKNVFILGGSDTSGLIFSSVINSLGAIAYSILKVNRPYLEHKNDVYITDDGKYGALNETKIAFNLIIITEMLIEKMIGGILKLAKR